MAARRGAQLTLDHARRVASGEATLAEIADSFGISRQSLWELFKRRGWATKATPIEDEDSLGGARAQSPPLVAAGSRSSPAASRPAASPSLASAAPSATVAAISDVISGTGAEDLREALRQELANVALLAIAAATSILSRPVGPTGLKATMGAVALATQQLAMAGYSIAENPNEVVPVMRIEEYTAKELAEIQAQAEREHRGVTAADEL